MVVLEEPIHTDRVGDVERKVATEALSFQTLEMVVIAHEESVSSGFQELMDEPVFSGFEDAWRGKPEVAIGGLGCPELPESLTCLPYLAGVIEFQINILICV